MIYVMSDIHGQAGAFYKMLKKICFSDNDQMYVLGDVIDRGPDGIEIIKYVMSKPNITLLIGNHEHMMLDALRTGLSHDYDLWFYNGGMMTLDSFNELGSAEKDKMLEYLKNCPVVIPDVKVNNRKFYLTHAGWLNRKSILLYKQQNRLRHKISKPNRKLSILRLPLKRRNRQKHRILKTNRSRRTSSKIPARFHQRKILRLRTNWNLQRCPAKSAGQQKEND